MKKLLLTALIGLVSTAALADHHQAVSVEGVKYKAEDSSSKESFDGFAVGYTNSSNPTIGWGVKAELLKGDYSDLTSVVVFAQKDLWSNGKTYVNASVGAGYSFLDLDEVDVSLSQIVLPLNLEAGVNVAKNAAVYGSVGYRFDFAVSDTKYITDGEDVYYVEGEDFDGLTYKVGVKYKF